MKYIKEQIIKKRITNLIHDKVYTDINFNKDEILDIIDIYYKEDLNGIPYGTYNEIRDRSLCNQVADINSVIIKYFNDKELLITLNRKEDNDGKVTNYKSLSINLNLARVYQEKRGSLLSLFNTAIEKDILLVYNSTSLFDAYHGLNTYECLFDLFISIIIFRKFDKRYLKGNVLTSEDNISSKDFNNISKNNLIKLVDIILIHEEDKEIVREFLKEGNY